jgi:hypothetical protein
MGYIGHIVHMGHVGHMGHVAGKLWVESIYPIRIFYRPPGYRRKKCVYNENRFNHPPITGYLYMLRKTAVSPLYTRYAPYIPGFGGL